MKIKAIECFSVTLPFRFSFGHSLASRADSNNVIVRVTLDDGTQGFGEGVPRDYVTGEDTPAAIRNVESSYAPRFSGLDVSDLQRVIQQLETTFNELGLHSRAQGASWCALELAIIDAVAKTHRVQVCNWFGPILTPRIRYGGVIPFGNGATQTAMLAAYKMFGFQTVKIKVGGTLEEDVRKVALARKIMGPKVILRVDANCAWDVDATLRAAEAFRPYNVASFEQPVPPDKLNWLHKITSQIEASIVVDESLCTLEQAELLAAERLCNAFNIRLSKVGGMLAAQKIVEIAKRYAIKCHMGAQVGESGILSAAARTFAVCNEPFQNYEGSMNAILLRRDITEENLTVRAGGYGDLSYVRKGSFGFGYTLGEGTLESWAETASVEADQEAQESTDSMALSSK